MTDWRSLSQPETNREIQNLRERIHAEPDHVTAVEMALSCPALDMNNRPVFAVIMLTRSALALVEQLPNLIKGLGD